MSSLSVAGLSVLMCYVPRVFKEREWGVSVSVRGT